MLKLCLLLLSCLLILLQPSAYAWFGLHKKAKPEPRITQPLPPNIEAIECEPYRQKAREWNAKPAFSYIFTRPIAAKNERKHKACLERVKEVQRLYLKQAELAPTQPDTSEKPATE